MVRLLASHFLAGPVRLNTFLDRSGVVVDEVWSLAEVPGPRFVNLPLYIAVGPRTGSAAEAFSYHLQALGRATIVGRATAGGANPGDVFEIGDEFILFISTWLSRNPTTGGNWEGTGVIPDVSVGAELALDRATELARGDAEKAMAAVTARLEHDMGQDAEALAEAGRLREEGDLGAAGQRLRSAIAKNKSLDFLWFRAGMTFHFAEDYDAAEAATTWPGLRPALTVRIKIIVTIHAT